MRKSRKVSDFSPVLIIPFFMMQKEAGTIHEIVTAPPYNLGVFCVYWKNAMAKPVTLELLVAPGCHICRSFEEFWKTVEHEWPNVTFKKVDVVTPEGQALAQKYMIFASPGIILNGELWATGGYDKEKFLAKLKELS